MKQKPGPTALSTSLPGRPRGSIVQRREISAPCASSSCQPPSLAASIPVYIFRKVWICCGLMEPGLFLLSFFIFFVRRFEPVFQLIISQSTGLVATAQHEAGETQAGPQKPLSRKSNFIIEKSSVLSSLCRCHKFTYSICRCWNTGALFA